MFAYQILFQVFNSYTHQLPWISLFCYVFAFQFSSFSIFVISNLYQSLISLIKLFFTFITSFSLFNKMVSLSMFRACARASALIVNSHIMWNGQSDIHGDACPYKYEKVRWPGLYKKLMPTHGFSAVVLNETVDSPAYLKFSRRSQTKSGHMCAGSPWPTFEILLSFISFRWSARYYK